MSTISIAEADLFSPAVPPCRIAVHKRVHDQLFGLIPFLYIDGKSLNVPWVLGDGLDAYATKVTAVDTALATSFPGVALAQVPLQHYATILEVDSVVLSQYGSRRDILKALIDVKVQSLVELVRKGLLTALSAAGTGNQILANAGAGGPVLAGEVESMLSLLSPGEDLSNRYLVMHAKALKHLRGGAYQGEISFMQHPDLGPLPAIGGVPVLIDNYLPINDPPGNRTSILGVVLDPREGYFGVLPCRDRGREIRVSGPFIRQELDTLTFHIQTQVGAAALNPLCVAKLASVQW